MKEKSSRTGDGLRGRVEVETKYGRGDGGPPSLGHRYIPPGPRGIRDMTSSHRSLACHPRKEIGAGTADWFVFRRKAVKEGG
jgi:hypothetical protein